MFEGGRCAESLVFQTPHGATYHRQCELHANHGGPHVVHRGDVSWWWGAWLPEPRVDSDQEGVMAKTREEWKRQERQRRRAVAQELDEKVEKPPKTPKRRMPPDDPRAYRRIRDRLEELELTYEAVGNEIGISAQAVSEIVNGRTKGATARYALAQALGVSPEELWKG